MKIKVEYNCELSGSNLAKSLFNSEPSDFAGFWFSFFKICQENDKDEKKYWALLLSNKKQTPMSG